MCGIVGFLDPDVLPRPPRAATLSRMSDALRHRGPDAAGQWVPADAPVALGHRRLSILDLSESGAQPLRSRDERYVLTYNGELYNYRELRDALDGHSFRGTSDTEVLVEAIAAWGLESALRKANGMFAFALWDERERSLVLARDRLGKKPLYYGWVGDRLYFTSEVHALRAAGLELRVDPRSVAEYLRYRCVPGVACIFEGFWKLEPGASRAFRPGRTRPGNRGTLSTYWSLGAADVSSARIATFDAAESALHELLGDAVRLRLESDVPLGAFLSGGIDSSLIVALMQAQAERPVRTFSIGFTESAYDEAPYAARVAHALGTEHQEHYVTPSDALAVIPRLPEIYDEPFADSSQIPTFLVARAAREHVTVCLTGDGGDELFLGYPRYLDMERMWRARSAAPTRLAHLGGRAAALIGSTLGHAAKRWPRWSRAADRLHLASAGLLVDDPADAYQAYLAQFRGRPRPSAVADQFETLPVPAAARGRTPAEAAAFVDARGYLVDDILVKVDRATMAVSLEARSPLLDYRVVDFAFGLPSRIRREGLGEKRLLRRILARYLPTDLFERPKMGFGVPVGRWLREPLRDWAEDLLSPAAVIGAGALRPAVVRQIWSEHVSGARDRTAEVWTLLVLQAWLRGLS